MIKKLIILFLHIIVAVIIGYSSYMILSKKQITNPNFIGLLLGFTVIAVAISYVANERCDSIYTDKANKKGLRGFFVDPNDPRSKPVGGFGGVGWV